MKKLMILITVSYLFLGPVDGEVMENNDVRRSPAIVSVISK